MRKPYSDEVLAVADNRIRRTCHRRQRNFVFDPARRTSACVGRGGGKTVGGIMRLLRRMMHRADANCLFIAATRQSAERLVWRDLKRIVTESLRLGQARFFEQDLVLELPNGSRLMLFGADDRGDIQKLRGITYHEVVIDEVASIRLDVLDELLTEVLGPRLVGALSLIGTPGKQLKGLFYEATAPGIVDDNGIPYHRPYDDADKYPTDWDRWSSHSWSIKDGCEEGIAALQEIHQAQLEEKKRNGWDDDNPKWLREFQGIWSQDNTTHVYLYDAKRNQWTPELDAFGMAKHDFIKDVGYAVGMDIGFHDAFALEVFAFSYSDPSRTLWHIYETYRHEQYANSISKLLIGERLSHDSYGGIVGHIRTWPDVLVADGAGKGAGLIKEMNEVYGVRVVEAGKQYKLKEHTIELANSMLYEGQVKVMKGSKLEDEMVRLQWDVDIFGKRTENKAMSNHGTDAFIYAREAVAPLLPTAGQDPPKPPVKRDRYDEEPRAEPVEEYGDRDAMYAPGDW